MLICQRYTERFPGVEYIDGVKWYFWQSSYCDAFDYHYIILCTVFENLSKYTRYESSSLKKYYKSADIAIQDLENKKGSWSIK